MTSDPDTYSYEQFPPGKFYVWLVVSSYAHCAATSRLRLARDSCRFISPDSSSNAIGIIFVASSDGCGLNPSLVHAELGQAGQAAAELLHYRCAAEGWASAEAGSGRA